METHYQVSAKSRDTTECQLQCSNFWKCGWFHYRETNHPLEQKTPKVGGKRIQKLQLSVNYILSAPQMPGGVMNLEISTRVTSQYLTPYVPKTHYSSGNESIGRKKRQTNKQRINYLQEKKLSLFSWVFPNSFKTDRERYILPPKLSFEFKLSLVWDCKDSSCLYELDWKMQTPPTLTLSSLSKMPQGKATRRFKSHILKKKRCLLWLFFFFKSDFQINEKSILTLNWGNVLGKGADPSVIPKICLPFSGLLQRRFP